MRSRRDRARSVSFARLHELLLAERERAAAENGASDEQFREPRKLQRSAQWRLDYVFAEN